VHDHCPQTAEKLPSGEFHFRPEWQELIHDPEVELVLIATPPAAHAVQIVTALHAGKHVAVESPLCLTPEEADAVLAAEQSTGRSVSVIDLRRYDDDFRAATSALAEGTIGKAR
jgi:predicted dehydrogenase